jgi:hypothetical protein
VEDGIDRLEFTDFAVLDPSALTPDKRFELLARTAFIFLVSGAFWCHWVSERESVDDVLGLISRCDRLNRCNTNEQGQRAKTYDAMPLVAPRQALLCAKAPQ